MTLYFLMLLSFFSVHPPVLIARAFLRLKWELQSDSPSSHGMVVISTDICVMYNSTLGLRTVEWVQVDCRR